MQGENVKNGMMQILHHYIEKKENEEIRKKKEKNREKNCKNEGNYAK